MAHCGKKGPCCRHNKEQIFPLVIERIFQKYAISEEIKVAVDTPCLPNVGSTQKKAIGARTGFIFWEKTARGIPKGESDKWLTKCRIRKGNRPILPESGMPVLHAGQSLYPKVATEKFYEKIQRVRCAGIFFNRNSFPTVQLTNHSTGTGHYSVPAHPAGSMSSASCHSSGARTSSP